MDKKTIYAMKNAFDEIVKIIQEEAVEFWYARDLMALLGYDRWENFHKAIERAIDSCKASEIEPADHFRSVTKMVQIGSGAERAVKRLSQNIYERGVDDAGFGRIRSRGDQALFGGKYTQEMKKKLGVSDKRPLADFLPTLTIAAKNLATEMTNYNVEEKDLQGESAITSEHVQNNQSVRDTLGSRGIKPEELPPSEDIKKLERRVKSQEKKLVQESGKLPQTK